MNGHFCKGAFVVDDPLPREAPKATSEHMQQLVNLIGKVAVRTKPCNCWQGYKDGSYNVDRVMILDVTEHHIFIEWIWDGSHRKSILNRDWIDGNWIQFPAGWS